MDKNNAKMMDLVRPPECFQQFRNLFAAFVTPDKHHGFAGMIIHGKGLPAYGNAQTLCSVSFVMPD